MNDLDQLKQLLFGAEKKALDSIAERVERPEIRTTDIADVLPEAIHQSHKKNDDLVESLAAPVGECLQQAVHDDPETYGNALYPVMGPAIRKSIMHTLRTLSQQINEAVEHSLSPRGMKWRWEASRAGIPFGEYILQKTMQYRVEQAYLISRENGLLIGHVHHEASKIKDSDAVSAMFTAIQDFVKESFSPDRTGRLESADMGEFTLWAVHGPHALLVCVIRGVPPKSLRADLSAILERLHFRYGDAIRDYKGDTTSVPGIENDLGRCLRFEARRERLQKRGFARIGIVALILLLAVAGYLLVRSWNSDRDFARLHDALANSPGIHVTELRRDGDSYALSGLRDPLAEPVSDIVASADIDPRLVAARMQPFQSLLPELVEARARQRLAPPPTARIVVEGTTLRVSGAAPAAWHRQLEQRYAMLAGIAALDSSALEVNDRPDIQGALERLDGHRFFFASGVELGSESAARIADHGQALRELAAMASADGQRFEVTLVGSTDSVGGNAMNEELARKRTEIVAQRLASYDLVISRQRQLLTPGLDEEPSVDPERRYVQVDIRLLDAPAQQ